MSKQDDEDELKARLERAKRLHEEIEALKGGKPNPEPDRPKSIKEQIEERTRERREKHE